jgi:glucose/arabinose dehydrogenase
MVLERVMISVAPAPRIRFVLCLSLSLLFAVSDTARAQLRLETYVRGLTLPVGFVQDPANPIVQYVVEQGGRVRLIQNGILLATPFLDLSTRVGCCGEQGLLGLAFPPDYASSGRFYVNYTNAAGDTVVARFLRSAGNPLIADPASWFPLRWGGVSTEIVQPYANHNGGHLAFGPDGYLYIGMGDGGSSNDPENRAQDPASLLGKMLRIDVNVPDNDPSGYVIPPDNPFQPGNALGALPEIWAFGLRNPWKFSFDTSIYFGTGTGALLIGDVGQNSWEEVDYQPAGIGGLNYGWRIREGARPNPNPLVGGNLPPAYLPLSDPILEYPHPEGASVIGGVVYRGHSMHQAYRGRYFFGDLNGRIWSVMLAPAIGGVTAIGLVEHTGELGGVTQTSLLTAIGTDQSGEIYFVNYTTGSVLRLRDWYGPQVPPLTADFFGDPIFFTWPYDNQVNLIWQYEPTGQLATWRLDGTSLADNTAGRFLKAPSLPPGWRVVGNDRPFGGRTRLFLQSDTGFLGMWVFIRDAFWYGVMLNPGRVSDPMWRVRAVGDFNHDGYTDLVWQYTPTGQIAFWLMNDINAVGYIIPSVPAPGPEWEIVGVGDANFDGELDLYWQDRTRGTLAVWHLVGTRAADGVVLSASPTDPGWRAAGIADLDRDGAPDILFQHATSGELQAWFFERERLRYMTPLTPSNTGDPNWKLLGPR